MFGGMRARRAPSGHSGRWTIAPRSEVSLEKQEPGPRPGELSLFAFAPVFNEEGSIRQVVQEWMATFRRLSAPFQFLVLDDGSTDRTLVLLQELRREFPELQVVGHQNRGHGPTCTRGYRMALESGAEWVFQIDSDGQCDPAYFPELWKARISADAVFGYRKRRDDGRGRKLVSLILSTVVFSVAGVWVRDSNVPYRLIRRPLLERVIDSLTPDTRFPNVLLSIAIARENGPVWVPIRFRQRSAGTSTVHLASMFHFAIVVHREIRDLCRRQRERVAQ